jgi:dienelactone hydrolase
MRIIKASMTLQILIGHAAAPMRLLHAFVPAAVLAAACGGGGGGAPQPPPGGNPPPAPIQGTNAAFQPPAFSGPLPVGMASAHWTDASREETLTSSAGDQRKLMVHLFYPADAAGVPATPVVRARHWQTLAGEQTVAGRVLRRSNYDGVNWPIAASPPPAALPARFPVVMFSHGGGGAVERNLFLIGELASHGYVVVAINHSYHADFVVFPDNSVAENVGFGLDNDGVISPPEAALLADAQVLWATDQIFVVDQLLTMDQEPGGLFESRLDLTRLAAGGFSLGGAASYEAASRDARIAAVVDIDGSIWPSGDPGILVPMLWLQHGAGEQFDVFDRVMADGYAALFDGSVEHLVFEDLSLFWRWDFPALHPYGAMDSLEALRATSELMRQFLAKYLDGAAAPALDDPMHTPPGIRVRRFP